MGCLCCKEKGIDEPTPEPISGSNARRKFASHSGESSSSGSESRNNKLWKDRTGYRLAEIENKTSNTLLFKERFREVWKSDLFKLEPEQRMPFPANNRLIDTAETYKVIEVMVVTSDGKPIRQSPSLHIEPLELVRCKHIIIKSQGSKLMLEKL